MDKFRVICDFFNWLTGRTSRHNRALRATRDWAAGVQDFLSEYQLDKNSGIDFLLKNTHRADFDLVSLAHKGNLLVKPASKIGDEPLSLLLTAVISDIVDMRRALMSPALRSIRLPECVSRLLVSDARLRERLSAIEFL